MMRRTFILIYGVVCYAIFFATFLYAIGFVGNIFVPRSLDAVPDKNLAYAVMVDFLLLGLFAIQHSVMARPAFKRWWTQYVPEAAERSTYVLFSSLALIALFAFWQPIGGVIWDIQNSLGYIIAMVLFGFGWGLVLVSTFLINHFDLFGLRQVWLQFRSQAYAPVKFKTPWLYKIVRHPLYVGWFFAFWATPTMTVTHLFFALVTTIYILIAIQLEERDLVAALGEDYADYRKRVPMLIPRFVAKRRVRREFREVGV